jgi:hypothetical protein
MAVAVSVAVFAVDSDDRRDLRLFFVSHRDDSFEV